MTWLRIGVALIVASALFFAPTAQAQSQDTPAPPGTQGSAVLRGTIRDSQNRPAVDATVYLQTTAGGPALVTRTDSRGSYRYSELRGGTYSMRAEKSGLGNAALGPFSLRATEAKQVDLTLMTQKTAEPEPAKTKPAFFDEPTFTVAGVTDSTYLGGHG